MFDVILKICSPANAGILTIFFRVSKSIDDKAGTDLTEYLLTYVNLTLLKCAIRYKWAYMQSTFQLWQLHIANPQIRFECF